MKRLSLFVMLTCTLCGAHAQVFKQRVYKNVLQEGATLSLQYGKYDFTRRGTISYESPLLWETPIDSVHRFSVATETGVSLWFSQNKVPDRKLVQLSFVPMVKWWPTHNMYVEAGVGATLFNKTRFDNKEFSTAFQFGNQIGAGWKINRHLRLGYRYSHFSNAGIKQPNPGLNMHQLLLHINY